MRVVGCVLSGNTTTGEKGGTGGGPPSYTGGTGSGNGGAIFNHGTLNLTVCTFSGNTAVGGGALFNYGSATLQACTISGNTATVGKAGGIFDYSYASTPGSVTMTDTIVAGNLESGGAGNDMFVEDAKTTTGGGITGSYNLVGDILQNGVDGNISGVTDPLLAPLGDYGEDGDCMPVLPGSPAIDAGIPISGVTRDPQNTPFGPTPDIGAFESNGFTLTPVAGSSPQGAAPGDPFANPLGVTVTAINPVEPVAGGVITFTAPPTTGATAVLSAPTAVIGSRRRGPGQRLGQRLIRPLHGHRLGVGHFRASRLRSEQPDRTELLGHRRRGHHLRYVEPDRLRHAGHRLAVPAGAWRLRRGDARRGYPARPPSAPTASTFSTTFTNTAGLHREGQSPYPIDYAFGGDDTYAPARPRPGSLAVTQATPTVAVADVGGIYHDNAAFPVTASVAGLSGLRLVHPGGPGTAMSL